MQRRPEDKASPAEVFEWAATYVRQYGQTPSQQMVRQHWPDWYPEPVADPLPALIEEFIGELGRRYFHDKVIELAKYEARPDMRHRLDEVMLDVARDLASMIPSGSVGRASDMLQRIDAYEEDKRQGVKRGYDMGIPLFDDLTYGLRPGKVYTLSGFSGRGKSTASGWMVANAVDQDATGLICSLEMTHEEILDRFDTMIMNFSGRDLMRRELPDEEVERWRKVAEYYKRAKSDLIVVDKLAGCTIDRIYAEINRYKPDVTVVDYIQRLKGHTASKARHEVLDDAANELKSIALQTESAIIICSQDNRSAAETGSTETSVAGSFGIYQASDVYIGMNQNDLMRERNQLELKLLKNRGGRGHAEAHLLADFEHMRFEPWQESAHAFTKTQGA